MPILEVGDDGVLRVPGELLSGAKPHDRFELDMLGAAALLWPAGMEGSVEDSWRHATPAQRAEAFEQWAAATPSDSPDLPAECLRRESLYD